MPTKVIMPQLGESVVEGKVNRWLKNVGDSIIEYEPLVEISTDKVDTEVPSPAAGTLLQIYVPEGETVERGVLLAMIGQPGEAIPTMPKAALTIAGVPVPDVTSSEPKDQAPNRISPVVARMAAEHQLDLTQIHGSGLGGRVTKKDVEAFLSRNQQPLPPVADNPTPTAGADLPPWEQPVSGDLFKPTGEIFARASQALTPSPSRREESTTSTVRGTLNLPLEGQAPEMKPELVPLSTMRRAIAEHMVRSKLQTSPHVTTLFEIDLSAVLAHQNANMTAFEKGGLRLTLTAYFVLASVKALQAQPWVNSQWTDQGVLLHKAAHIGLAVAIPDGLIVPVIHNAQDLNLTGAARQVNDLASRARTKQLRPDEVSGGTFTITNHGVSGSLLATPIINQPQAAILGIGAMQKRVVVLSDARGDTIAIRPMIYATLTFDHRLIDGAIGDGFMTVFKQALEGWPSQP